ncbi:N-acetylmuramoyl-L-alanine amidase [Peribacillus deserti]|uniref:N-acetylmuramoyl-L-alanine amidase n=1 Tax=Peribacillus deserti TaxID=673318 RepID=A0A2N5M3S5_9BACI|nr:N-acetylmuramoyl-L-alanine amidase [Peribacillus deserti]PLT29014.1 N-acetylmuramoyl-L-alanine amidase [Peribacillus deserti]
MKFMLDAGHGYNTPGKRSPDGFKEYEFNRAVASYAKESLLTYQNVTVYFAHSDKNDVPLKQRTDFANSLGVDVYVSIHANAAGNGTAWVDAEGIETYIHTSKPKESLALAKKVQASLINKTGVKDRGVKTADFHVLRESSMTAILIECGFMTSRRDIKLLRSDYYRKACAEAIVKALAQQYGLKAKPKPAPAKPPAAKPAPAMPAPAEPATPPSKPSEDLHKVQVGAFSDRKNAEELVKQLKKAGFDASIL